ncbi:8464_t:CDS:2, partial [Entrophospora sp. SA101]
ESSRKEAEEERKKAYRRHHPKAVIIEEIDNFIASFNQIAGIKDNFEISETLLQGLRDRGLIIRADDEITPQFILLNREITPTLADALVTIQVIAADINNYANAENTGLFTTFDGITVNPILTDKNDTHTVRNEDELRTGFNRQVDHINGNYTRLAGDLSEVRKAIDFLNSFAESAPNTPRSRVWEGNTDSQNLLQDLRAREIVLVERAARERENARRPLPSWTWKLGGDSTDPVAIFNEYGEEVAYPIETLDKAALDEAHSIRSVITNPTNFSDLVNGTIFTAPNKDSRVGEITADVAGRDTFNRNFTYTSFGIETVGVKPYNHDKNQLDNVHEIIKDINAKTVVNMDDLNEEAGKEIFDRIEAITAVDNAKLPNIRKKVSLHTARETKLNELKAEIAD